MKLTMHRRLLILTFVQVFLFMACTNNMVEEEVRTPDEQFLKIDFRYGFGNELNTYDMTFTKDLVLDGYVTVDFWLTTEEQENIVGKLEENDFANLPDTIATYSAGDSIAIQIIPSPGRQFIKAKFDNIEKEVSFYFPLPEGNPASAKILDLYEFIINIIHNKPEYQQLPEPRGGRI